MRNFLARLILVMLCLGCVPAFAQSSGKVVADCTIGVPLAYPVGSNSVPTILPTGANCVFASVSASITGFPTTQTTGTPISVTTGGVTGTLPSGTVVVASNVGGTNNAYCKLGASATTSDQLIAPASWFAFTVGAATQLTCITSTSTTTVNMVGGSGLPTGSGGGGGGSGGSVQSATVPVSTMNSASANSGLNAAMAGVFDDASPTAITENSFGFLRMSANRNLYGTIRDAAGNERGANVNANNEITVAVNSGSVFNANGTATPANSSPVVLPYTTSTTGNIAANNTTAVVVNAGATTLMGVQLYGIGSAPAYLKIYNATSATCGSGTPVKRLMIPAASTAANGAGSNITFGSTGLRLATGLTYCVTTGITDADATAPAASTFLINIDWL